MFRCGPSRRHSDTNLVIHHGVTNVFSQAGQRLGILDIIEEARDFAPFRQQFQISENLVELPGDSTSGSNVDLDMKEITL